MNSALFKIDIIFNMRLVGVDHCIISSSGLKNSDDDTVSLIL